MPRTALCVEARRRRRPLTRSVPSSRASSAELVSCRQYIEVRSLLYASRNVPCYTHQPPAHTRQSKATRSPHRREIFLHRFLILRRTQQKSCHEPREYPPLICRDGLRAPSGLPLCALDTVTAAGASSLPSANATGCARYYGAAIQSRVCRHRWRQDIV